MDENEDIFEPDEMTEESSEPEEVVEEEPGEEEEIQPDIPVIPSDWAMPKPYHMTMTMADGTVLDAHIRKDTISGGIWVYMDETPMSYVEIVMIFSNPEKTSVMENHVSEEETEIYTGYTRLVSINSGIDGKFILKLTRPIE